MRKRLQAYKETIEASLSLAFYVRNLMISVVAANRTEAYLCYATGATHATR